MLPAGDTWADKISICTAEKRVVSRHYDECLEACKDNEEPNEGHCECDPASLPLEDDSACRRREDCRRVQSISGRDICLEGPCMDGWKVKVSGNVCVEKCENGWTRSPYSGERRCVEVCPHHLDPPDDADDGDYECPKCASVYGDRPFYSEGGCTDKCREPLPFYQREDLVCTDACPEEEPYHEAAGECYPRCPVWTFQVPGDSLCVAANPDSPSVSTVSFAGTSYAYAYRLAPSYAVLDLAVQKIGAAFLETETVLASSRIRAVAKVAAYAPAVFFQAGTVLACEL